MKQLGILSVKALAVASLASGVRGYPQCVTLHSCPAHARDSPTNRSRCLDALKIFANEKDFRS